MRIGRLSTVGGLLFFLLPLGKAVAEPLQLHWGIDASVQGFLVQQEPLDAKWQGAMGSSLALRLLFPNSRGGLSPFISIEGGGRFRFQSDISKGYLYTGFLGAYTGLGAGIFLKERTLLGKLLWRPGLSLGILGGLYIDTTGTHYRFFPSLRLEPLGEIPRLVKGKDWQLRFRLGLPITWNLRPDMELSLGFGLRVGVRISSYREESHD